MTTDTPPAAPITAEREAFETWFSTASAQRQAIELGWRGIAFAAWQERARLSAPVAAQPADSAMEALRELADEVARVLPILARAEDSGLWSELAAGTGVATTNALVHRLQRARTALAAFDALEKP